MNNTAETNSNSATPAWSCSCDWKAILERVKFVAMNPSTCWQTIKAENDPIPDLYRKYFFVLAAIPAIAGFIGASIVGISIPLVGTYRAPFFGQLVFSIVSYALSLALLYVGAMVIEKLAPKFEGQTDTLSAFKLIGFSMAPMMLISVLGVIPVLGLLATVAGLYGLYLYFQGIPTMTGVPEAKRIPFAIVTIISVIVVNFVAYLLIAFMAPTPGVGDLRMPTGEAGNFDPRKLEDGVRELQKLMPPGN